MKKTLLVIVVLCLAMAVVAGCKSQTNAPEQSQAVSAPAGKIKIGFFGPLTGPSANSGRAMKDGADLAVKHINNAGGILGHKIELIAYDDKSSTEEAVKNTTRLVQVDEVTAIVGSLHSGNVLAAAPVLEEYQTPTVGCGTSPTWLQQGYTYLFRSVSNTLAICTSLADYANTNGLLNIASIHSNDEYGNQGSEDFLAALEKYGGKYVADESFLHGDRDFTGQFAKIIASNPDAVLTWGMSDDLGPLIKQLRQVGYSGPILGSESYVAVEVMDVAGEASNNVFFGSQYLVYDDPSETSDPLMVAFLESYKAEFGTMPQDDNAYRAYDAINIIAEGIKAAGSLDRPAIRQGINDIQSYTGLAGNFSFAGKQGEGIETVRIYEIVDGKFVEIG